MRCEDFHTTSRPGPLVRTINTVLALVFVAGVIGAILGLISVEIAALVAGIAVICALGWDLCARFVLHRRTTR